MLPCSTFKSKLLHLCVQIRHIHVFFLMLHPIMPFWFQGCASARTWTRVEMFPQIICYLLSMTPPCCLSGIVFTALVHGVTAQLLWRHRSRTSFSSGWRVRIRIIGNTIKFASLKRTEYAVGHWDIVFLSSLLFARWPRNRRRHAEYAKHVRGI